MVCPYFIPEEPRIHREQEFFRSLLVAAALGTFVGDQSTIPVLDWNGDKKIDVLDLAYVASYLGTQGAGIASGQVN